MSILYNFDGFPNCLKTIYRIKIGIGIEIGIEFGIRIEIVQFRPISITDRNVHVYEFANLHFNFEPFEIELYISLIFIKYSSAILKINLSKILHAYRTDILWFTNHQPFNKKHGSNDK